MGIELLLWVMLAGITAYSASQRGRPGPRWFAIGLCFPAAGLIALLLMQRLPKTGIDALVHEDLRPCPACAKAIAAAASRCRHCAASVAPIAVKQRSGWVARFTPATDEEYQRMAAQLAQIDIPTVLDEPPHLYAGPCEEKGEAQNLLRYLKTDHGLTGLVTWRTVER